MSNFLDAQLSHNFRKKFNSTLIFSHAPKFSKGFFNLCCAIMDRLDDDVTYLNNNATFPNSEDVFLSFLMRSCTVIDGIKTFYKALKPYGFAYPYDDSICSIKYNQYEFFEDICLSEQMNLTPQNCPTDDKFFAYFRSLVFAHPFETSKEKKIIPKGEIHYSPYVMVGDRACQLSGILNGVGVLIYSNVSTGFKTLVIDFNLLKRYIQSRYTLLESLTEALESLIYAETEVWKKRKVITTGNNVEILKDISSILEERYVESYEIDSIIAMLQVENSSPKNAVIVDKFKKYFFSYLDLLIESINQHDIDFYYEVINLFRYNIPKNVDKITSYQLQKIFTDNVPYEIYEYMAHSFSNGFAKKWVHIDVNSMEREEVQLLVTIACYYEVEEETRLTHD